ncbi:hypothetical protein [Rhodococcus sp. HS-D2]|uniref:hypothetical protein n=1 Tax=Rhodococcus sp. HS-D2 TaxID=1384636 RepID=UPI0007D903FE|nr:hypothetical protein [Rhodococcus sp. HS-D2]
MTEGIKQTQNQDLTLLFGRRIEIDQTPLPTTPAARAAEFGGYKQARRGQKKPFQLYPMKRKTPGA